MTLAEFVYTILLKPRPLRRAAEPGAHVWVLADGAPKPLLVRTGINDGTSTELVQSPLPAGAEVIVGTIARAAK